MHILSIDLKLNTFENEIGYEYKSIQIIFFPREYSIFELNYYFLKLADIAVIGGCNNYMPPPFRFLINFIDKNSIRDDVEVISIVKDSVSYCDKVIPSLPKELFVD